MKLDPDEIVYMDTSYWVAMRIPRDVRHGAWRAFHPQIEECRLAWTPWHHAEVVNTLRQVAYTAPDVLPPDQARANIAALERDASAGYFHVQPVNWHQELHQFRHLSRQLAYGRKCRAGDLLHVAGAVELSASLFVTFDADQAALAAAADLPTRLLQA